MNSKFLICKVIFQCQKTSWILFLLKNIDLGEQFLILTLYCWTSLFSKICQIFVGSRPLIIQASVHTIWIFSRLFEQNKLFLCNFQGQCLSYFSILTTKIAKVDVRTNFKGFFFYFQVEMAHKVLSKDMSDLVNAMKLVEKYSNTTVEGEYRK